MIAQSLATTLTVGNASDSLKVSIPVTCVSLVSIEIALLFKTETALTERISSIYNGNSRQCIFNTISAANWIIAHVNITALVKNHQFHCCKSNNWY